MAVTTWRRCAVDVVLCEVEEATSEVRKEAQKPAPQAEHKHVFQVIPPHQHQRYKQAPISPIEASIYSTSRENTHAENRLFNRRAGRQSTNK